MVYAMYPSLFLPLVLMTALASATQLFVASQAGLVATLALKSGNGTFQLEEIHTNRECGASPTWLMKDPAQNTLVCVDENNSGGPGQITSFSIRNDRSLVRLDSEQTGTGPVHSQRYGNGGEGLVVAEFGQGGVSSWRLSNETGNFTFIQSITFPNLTTPGPVANRQTKPAAHQAILDPTGRFIVVPDLGADKLRTFTFNNDSLQLTGQRDFDVPPGSGPRHGVFTRGSNASDPTRFYVVNELNAKIYAFNVTYPEEGRIQLDLLQEFFTHGNFSAPKNAPGELEISADQRFLTISNRLTGDISIKNPNPDPTQPCRIAGDSLSTFAINPEDGTLQFLAATSSGGASPRQFQTNRAGNLTAVANTASQNVAIFRRDPTNGALGCEPLASHFFAGENQLITAVIWDE